MIPYSFNTHTAMSNTPIRSILRGDVPIGTSITINGWVRSRRTSKGGFSFIHVNDGSCLDNVQAVADDSLPNYGSEIAELSTGCSVSIDGTVVASEGRGQECEVKASAVRVLGGVEDPEHYPIAKKHHTFEYLRSVAHLRPRTNTFGAISRVRHTVAQAVHRYFDANGFCWVNTPIITASDCEGAGALFRVSTLDLANRGAPASGGDPWLQDFFGTQTYLTVSGQLNVESYCLALSKVYTFGPTFRAENSNTSRHLAEFWMIEPEIAFADLGDNADLAEDFLKSVIGEVLARCPEDMAFFAERIDKDAIARLEHVVSTPFERIDYSEAIRILERAGVDFEFPVRWGLDLQSEHERYLTEQHVKGPVVVVNYPKEIKAFYMRLNDDDRTVAAMDVLVPGVGEIVGGSQREERLSVLDARMAEQGLGDELWWYRDLRRYGTVPHAGFGLGLERLVLYMTGMENIRDVIPFPRVPNSASF
ncbi:MAG: asparagine--tRNA ligase [Pseudomonadales bacterium]